MDKKEQETVITNCEQSPAYIDRVVLAILLKEEEEDGH